MYQQRRPQNTTSINELLDIDELELSQQYQPVIKNPKYHDAEIFPNGEANKFEKYIRQTHHIPAMESGMNMGNESYKNPNINEMYKNDMYKNEEYFTEYLPVEQSSSIPYKKIEMPPNSPSCIEVAEHLLACPVCSRLYNNDKTVYIIAIVILAFICILLLKKVLDV